ncbi:MAG: helix-turn-helix domain-containing protein [Chitinophagales bacterium]|nr:helix-turn-helix domain-containing protein [Chitinophagales bacterium]
MTNHTIAVLPFHNISSNPENEYFSDGITEEIINALAGIENLKVTSRTSSFFYKNKKIPLKQLANELGVAVILEGSVRRSGDMVRITAQLIQAEEDFHFWSDTWDRKLENIFEIQDEISLLIADKLREQFGHFEIQEHLVQKQTESLDAYEYSLRARYHFNKWNPEDVRQAIELYKQAIAIDPNHTESYLGLADAYGFLATTKFLPHEEAWQLASEYTQKALSLNPENAGVHYQLGNLAFFTAFDYQKAFKHAVKSISLKQSHPEAQQFTAFLYMLSGMMTEAKKHLDLALSIDPLSQETQFYKSYFHYRLNEYDKALDILNDCLRHNPKNIPAYVTRFYCLLKMERYDEVLHYIDQMPEEIIVEGDKIGILTLTYILKGDKPNAHQYLEILQSRSQTPTAFQEHAYLFLAYANLKDADRAFEWLEEVLNLNSSILLLAYTDPLCDTLHDDKRYSKYKSAIYGKLVTPKAKSLKKKTALVDEEAARVYTKHLLQFLKEEMPYLNPTLSLRSLAQLVQIHPNQLSWILNQSIGKNFNTFINHYRIEHFKSLVVDPANSHISLIGLAFESGFNSKTVFNTYFKKETGITPKEYLKNQ